ncbi:hypothetical protein CY34DRAFT_19963 [Suillus luteus UH-Slu-Lm8-n1]|uniref:Uncharacterized protein n=1 Tax=Suillus luteus UH-Slu-Lm8-n1 TaxID=930992 RepID=A0A0C9ZQ45_9AGAM|nr:hypothetical protein CY34DRAFT_19963 [Suillus luteus UH-Slu-Lm8-n1]
MGCAKIILGGSSFWNACTATNFQESESADDMDVLLAEFEATPAWAKLSNPSP